MTPDEKWLPVVGYEGLYEVSNLGRVRTVPRIVPSGPPPGTRQIASTIRKHALSQTGYPQITLQRKTHMVHTLVAAAFLGPRPEGYECCHNDGNPLNTALSNLRYDTVSENRLDTVRHGRNRESNKTHCPQGHVYPAPRPGHSRRCLTCHRERERARYHSRKKAPQ